MATANINGVELYYEEHGSGPPILFHHGFTGSHDGWAPIAERLQDRFRCILMDSRGAGDSEIAEEDLSIAFYRDFQIDLLQLVHEQCRLALPMKPLCRDACRGLCPVCGTNLNERTCNCETAWRDPRLAALEALVGGRRH